MDEKLRKLLQAMYSVLDEVAEETLKAIHNAPPGEDKLSTYGVKRFVGDMKDLDDAVTAIELFPKDDEDEDDAIRLLREKEVLEKALADAQATIAHLNDLLRVTKEEPHD